MINYCLWCDELEGRMVRGVKIGEDYAYDILHCTECHAEWLRVKTDEPISEDWDDDPVKEKK